MEKGPVRINMHSAYDYLQSWWSDDGIPFYNDNWFMNEYEDLLRGLL